MMVVDIKPLKEERVGMTEGKVVRMGIGQQGAAEVWVQKLLQGQRTKPLMVIKLLDQIPAAANLPLQLQRYTRDLPTW
jgi:hypothetical protein